MSDLQQMLRGEIEPVGPVQCPFHGDVRASAQLYPNGKFYCHACGHKAKSLVDLVRQLYYPHERFNTGMSLAKAYLDQQQVIIPTAGPSAPPARVWASEQDIIVMSLFKIFAALETPSEVYQELRKTRGLTNPSEYVALAEEAAFERTIQTLRAESFLSESLVTTGITYDDGNFRLRNRMLVVDRRAHEVIYYQARALGPARAKYLNPPRLSKPLYGEESLRYESEFVLIGEGPFDVLPFIEQRISAIALLGAVPMDLDVSIFRGRPVIVGLDADRIGLEKGALLTQGLRAGGVTAYHIPPQEGKDYGEWVTSRGIQKVLEVLQWVL